MHNKWHQFHDSCEGICPQICDCVVVHVWADAPMFSSQKSSALHGVLNACATTRRCLRITKVTWRVGRRLGGLEARAHLLLNQDGCPGVGVVTFEQWEMGPDGAGKHPVLVIALAGTTKGIGVQSLH